MPSVVHLTVSLSSKAGGIQSSLLGLTNHLVSKKNDIQLWSFREKGVDPRKEGFRGKTKLFSAYSLPGFQCAPGMPRALAESESLILHLHGLWSFTSIAALYWDRLKPKIVSPHGMLDPWALGHSGWKKRLALFLYENKNLRDCSCFHALCEQEYGSIRKLGFGGPVAVIPNGVELPLVRDVNKSMNFRTLLYLGRLHEKKNLAALIHAWKTIAGPKKKNWLLRVCGWGTASFKKKLMDFPDPTLSIEGPLYGAEKDLAYRNASAFVLPSLSEGLPMAVLEAWSYGLPVLMSKECNLPEGFKSGAALETGTSPLKIEKSIIQLIKMTDSHRSSMGARGRSLVERDFTWPLIASKMTKVYQWLLGRGTRPEWVKVG